MAWVQYRYRCIFVIAGATSLLINSCAPPPLPPSDEVLGLLSHIILRPEGTCEELRAAFDLEHLPLADYPSQAGLDYEEHLVPTEAGLSLRVWHLPAEASRGMVIVSPGAVASMSCYLFTAKLLVDNGWSVVIYEYEGFGGSGGAASLVTLESDLRAVLDWTRAHTGAERVTLAGISLGCIPSVAVAVAQPDAVNAVILDSPVALGLEIRAFRVLLGARTEEIIALLDPSLVTAEIIADMPQPLLIFLHELDEITHPAAVELVYERAAGPKEMVRFPDLAHARGQYLRTEDYMAHVEAFLIGVWEPQRLAGSAPADRSLAVPEP